MTQSIGAREVGVVHKYVATFTQQDMAQVAQSQGTTSYEINIDNPVENANVNVAVVVRGSNGSVLPGLDIVTAQQVMIRADVPLTQAGPGPYSVTIFG